MCDRCQHVGSGQGQRSRRHPVTMTEMGRRHLHLRQWMACTRRLAGIRRLVAMESVENDNDEDTGTNVGRVKGDFVYSYFVSRVYIFRYPTECSHPCKLNSKILALSVVETIILSRGYTTTSRYLLHSYLGWARMAS